MGFSDMVQIALVTAVIFFLIGYTGRPFFIQLLQAVQSVFVSPRYIKSKGIWVFNKTKAKGKSIQ
jgi:cellulose biosynthesis operon protein BcsF/YhjT